MSEPGGALKIAVGSYGSTLALLSGEVRARDLELDFVSVRPMIAAYRRMIRALEFDVCEMAPTTYLIAREAGIPITALPVFLMRRFEHGSVQCRPGSGIAQPRDLEGREVGLRAYSVTTGVWVRGFLRHQYDVDIDSITWVVDDDEHVESLELPANVRRLPEGESVAEMFAGGRLDAALGGNAGTGRSGSPTGNWEQRQTASAYPLFPEPDQAARDWYTETGVYPLHAIVCVKESVVEERPWVVGSLTDAFEASRRAFLQQLQVGPAADGAASVNPAELDRYRTLARIVGDDPLPYGLDRNESSLRALVRFSWEQGLISSMCEVSELFAN